MIHFSQLESIGCGKNAQLIQDGPIKTLSVDSRKIVAGEDVLFFAIKGPRHDGHAFIRQLYDSGVRQFVVETAVEYGRFPKANFLVATSSLGALQNLVAFHRQQHNLPVIGITGSNGKTIVKEWLFQLLSPEFSIVKNPGSYNSQLGVPLSVWQLKSFHQLAIFEAGISQPGEMARLENVIRPTLGLLTNIGSAHDEGFENRDQKIDEKLNLFSRCDCLIYRADDAVLDRKIKARRLNTLSWGLTMPADISVSQHGHDYKLKYGTKTSTLHIPFADPASIENCLHGIVIMMKLGYDTSVIQRRIQQLTAVPMRLELKPGINGCQLIDDSYNNDLAGLKISLDFLQSQQRSRKTIILSDLFQTGLEPQSLAKELQMLLRDRGLARFIGVGQFLSRHEQLLNSCAPETNFYPSVEALLADLNNLSFQRELVLIKGARAFHFEQIVNRLQAKAHGTVMEIDLNKVVHNLNVFRARLNPGVKLMVMVKALAYGSGSEQIANMLQYHNVDYLGVAYADEGADLRKNQIALPIMVMNPAPESFQTILTFGLEPVVYNLRSLRQWISFLNGGLINIHLELDTGMHRLGFDAEDLPEMIRLLQHNKNIHIVSVFSHLAGADESVHDEFTQQQAQQFSASYERIAEAITYRPLRHILNSPGQIRHQQFQWDMVRLGIGLYGINPTEESETELKPAISLKTIVSQVRHIARGDSVGYGRKQIAKHDMVLATIAIGYADGFSRSFSRGKGVVLINGKRAPVVGNVCMDMTMVDVTGTDVAEGDEVIVFGEGLPVSEVARNIDTIAYEILTNTSERVKRVFYAESI